MPTSVISNVILDASGVAKVGVNVVARPSPSGCFRIDTGTEVAAVTTTSSNVGAWSLVLEQNSNLTPAGSFYVIEEDIVGSGDPGRQWQVVVGATNQTLAQVLGFTS